MSTTLQNQGTPLPSDDRESGESSDRQTLPRREAYLAAAQRLSHTGSFGWTISSNELYWSEETFRIFECDPAIQPTVEVALQRVHPDDAESVKRTLELVSQEQKEFDFEFRLLMPNRAVKFLRVVARPERDAAGDVEFIGAVMDITTTREAEERFRRIVDTVPAQIWTADGDGRIDFISQRQLEYFGETFERASGGEPGFHVHPDEAGAFRDQWREKIAEGRPFELEVRWRRFDGEYRWFLILASPLVDPEGNVGGWFGNNIDIHERKQAAEKLRESEAYLAEAQRLSGTGSWAWNPRTAEIRYWSHECFPMLGFDERDGIPPFGDYLQRIHPDDRAGMMGPIEQARQDRTDFVHEYRVVLPNGDIREIHGVGHPVFSPSGELLEFVGSVIDYTERNRAQEALRSSEERLRLIVDNIPGMLCTHTPEGELEFANQRLLDYTGRTLASVQDWDWVSLIHPDDLAITLELWSHSVTTGEPYAVDHRTRSVTGSYQWFHVTGLPLRDEHGRIVRWYILLSDIDDRKRAEAALSKAQTELAHITRITTMGELTASIAHEVNQPLAAVVNNASACLNFLQSGAPDVAELRDALAEIVEDADRAGTVIARIRQLAKRTPCEKSLLDLQAVVADTLLLARGESVARGVTISTELPDEKLPVNGDRVQLQQVLLNLVVNGMDAMNTVEESKRALLIRVCRESRNGKRETVVSVRDSGIGLRGDDMARLFEAFYTTKPHGMGMGLSISRSIIEVHGGRLWAEPNPDGGATFRFRLPQAGDEP